VLGNKKPPVIVSSLSPPLFTIVWPLVHLHYPPNEQLLVSIGVGAPSNAIIIVVIPPPPPPPLHPPLSVIGCHCHLLSIPCCPTHDPPHRQWLIRGRGRWCVVVVVIVPPLFAIPPTCRSFPIVVCHLLSFISCCCSSSVSFIVIIPVCCHLHLPSLSCLSASLHPPNPPCKQSLTELEVGALSLVPASTWQIRHPSSVIRCPSTIPVVPPTSHPTSSGLWAWGQVVGCLALWCCLGGRYNMK
jgi:hypothetical protein